MADIIIEAEGPDAQGVLDLATNFFAEEFGVKASLRPVERQTTTKGLGLEWLAIALSIPSAIVDTMDLTARLKLIERTTAMLEALRGRLGSMAGVIRIGAKHSFDIATAKARAIIEAIAEEDGGDTKK